MSTVISMRNANKRYPQFGLENLNLELESGEILGLVGVNGAGKSTTLRILMGLIEIDSGEVEVFGQAMPKAQVAVKQNIGFASDDMRLYKQKTLGWHMQLIRASYRQWDDKYATHLLQRFKLKPEQLVKGLSHGQRVKACLLLLLARRPPLLILDEPTTGLDPVARLDILEELAEILRDENRSVLFSSHNTQDIEKLSDRIMFLHEGRVIASKDKDSFIDDWRSVRCSGNIDPDKICIPGITRVKKNGSLIDITVQGYREDFNEVLRAQKLEIIHVSRLTLEEIFIANIRREMMQ